ncbi:hypothetical protein M408DRAFT_290448 [Serendipita vermifera MAFF 305830]|uniref:NACHT domain-containing protein n=1 Tax=Serendipita vermifera MAFF 305830 TaxID=933852 RepID=A0A0C3ACN2_SERVB|nr:hypothetical protein M408DRAFT_290448 [Serendipita vermifera MAFF 305830]
MAIKRLSFHLATIENQSTRLKEDVKINLATPPLDLTFTNPLENYTSIMTRITAEDHNAETLEQKINELDTTFSAYSVALHRSVANLVLKTEESPFRSIETAKHLRRRDVDQSLNVYGKQHKRCLQGTRRNTLSAIRRWVDDKDTSKRIFCLLDFAGSGKSTVAKTIAAEWGRCRLFARFFFSRDSTATASTNSFFSIVSNGFACLDQDFRESVNEFMEQQQDWELLSFEEQFGGLIAGPLRQLSRRAILMIDALDECDNKHGRRDELLEILSSEEYSPLPLKVLVTGRPERDIMQWARNTTTAYITSFRELEGNDEDVERYIRTRLQNLPRHVQDRISLVIHGAEGVFIWARLACDLLLSTVDKEALLDKLKGQVRLDDLYRIALEQSIPQDIVSKQATEMVLQMILAAKEPLSIAELDMLFPKRGIVEEVVTLLGSLLLYQNLQDPVRLLHTTFRDFLTARLNTDLMSSVGSVRPELGHYILALGCTKLLEYYSKQDDAEFSQLDQVSYRKGFQIFLKLVGISLYNVAEKVGFE